MVDKEPMDSRVHNIDKVKHSGQVFTPDYLVGNILDCSEYSGQRILRRHVIDNSCGDGAFICVFVIIHSAAGTWKYTSTISWERS